MRRVAITGLGVVSPVGSNPPEFFRNLLAGRSGIRRISAPFAGKVAAKIAGEVDFDPAAHFSKVRLATLDRFSQFALVAAAQAIQDAGLALTPADKLTAGVAFGTGLGGALVLDEAYRELYGHADDPRIRPLTVVMTMNNAAAAQVAIEHGLHGPNHTVSTACSSSAIAIGEAARAIRHGYAEVMLAGGSEALLTLGTLKAWDAMRALAVEDAAAPAASCRPFSKDRTGLVLGEGAGVLVLEELGRAERRGARIYAELAGYGAANDAFHVTKPDAAGQARAMALALADAGLAPDAIDYVNAHGTATPVGDVIETEAIKQVFGAHARRLPVSSTKSMHGHLMGAAGAVELIAAVLAITHQALPPTAHLRVPDPECDLDYVPNTGRTAVSVKTVMSNAFAFGGSNAVLIARAIDR